MDFIFSADIARANLLAMQSDVSDEVFNIGGGHETSLLKLLNCLLEAYGKTDVQPEFLQERAVNPVPRRLADVELAASRIGFRAEVDLASGLQELIEWRREAMESGTISAYVTDGTEGQAG